jgi:hypothetical protein
MADVSIEPPTAHQVLRIDYPVFASRSYTHSLVARSVAHRISERRFLTMFYLELPWRDESNTPSSSPSSPHAMAPLRDHHSHHCLHDSSTESPSVSVPAAHITCGFWYEAGLACILLFLPITRPKISCQERMCARKLCSDGWRDHRRISCLITLVTAFVLMWLL